MSDTSARNVRILVADDAELFRNLMKDFLTQEGFEVLLAKDGLEALQTIKHELPNLDLVLLDLLLPKMTGFDVLREARKGKLGAALPILCITGVFKHPDKITELQKLGATGFMTKDLSPGEIVDRIKRTLAEAPAAAGPSAGTE